MTAEKQADILALDEALTQFALHYPRQSQVVEFAFLAASKWRRSRRP